MKTQVISLELHDDLTSIQEKMAWAKTERILLVFPRRPRSALRTLDLRRLQRQAESLGAQLAVVTRSESLRQAAGDVGLAVFEDSQDAQRADWPFAAFPERPGRRSARPDLLELRQATFPPEPVWLSHGAVRLTIFSISVLALLSLLAVFMPSATLTLHPLLQLQSLDLPANASRDTATVLLAGGLPSRTISIVLEGSRTEPVSGTLDLPDRSAAGLVVFRNLTVELIGIPAGTVVRTVGEPVVRFVTTTDAVVEPGVGRTVDVPVEALEGGSEGNLPSDALIGIEGDLGASLAVINPSPTEGGSSRSAPVQTSADRTRLRSALQAELELECSQSLPAALAPGDLFFPDTVSVVEVLSESFFPAEVQSSQTLTLTLNVRCQAAYASALDLTELARLNLDATLPDGFGPLSGEITYLVTSTPETDPAGSTHWQMHVERSLVARIDKLAAVQICLGRRPADAGRRLVESLPLDGEPGIQVEPSGWPWLPVIPFRINVVLTP